MPSSKTNTNLIFLFYFLAFAWAWAFWVPAALFQSGAINMPESLPEFIRNGSPAAWGPFLSAFLVTFLYRGMSGVKSLIARLFRVRFGLIWYLIALTLLPTIVGTAQLIAGAQGAEIPTSEAFANPVSIPFSFLWIFFLGGPLQEEIGWRGIATDTIQNSRSAVLTSLFVGVLWGLWHLPLFYMPRAEIYYNQPVLGLIGSTVLLSILLTWVYNNTGRSLFAVMLMHTSFNWANFLFTALQTDAGGFAYFLLLAATVVLVVLIFGHKTLTKTAADC